MPEEPDPIGYAKDALNDALVCLGQYEEERARLRRTNADLLAACLEAERVVRACQGMVIISRDPGTQRCLDLLERVIAKAAGA